MSDQNNAIDTLQPKENSCCAKSSCCAPVSPIKRTAPKVGRNDPCPCGNGRKFKKCCGKGV